MLRILSFFKILDNQRISWWYFTRNIFA